MASEPSSRYEDLPRAPVAADVGCPATGARATGSVLELHGEGASFQFDPGASLAGFDVGATVDCTFISATLGGSHTLRGRVVKARAPRLEVAFESRATIPLQSLFNRRNSLRIRRAELDLDQAVDLVLGGDPPLTATLDDLSMTGVAVVVHRPPRTPHPDDRVRLRLTGPEGLTVWVHGAVRHVSVDHHDVRLGIAFDLRLADLEGSAPALRELVRQIERKQLDLLMLAHAGVSRRR